MQQPNTAPSDNAMQSMDVEAPETLPPSSTDELESSPPTQESTIPSRTPSFIVAEATWRELIRAWIILGWTAFGGPAAHVGMFQKLFVEKLRWCTYVVFTELLMLGQCMPGPTSTQMGFALGVLKKGLAGGLVSGILFQGPGLLILSILGWAAARVLHQNIGWLNGLVAGLAAAGIALVASAAVSLTKNICTTRLLLVLATASAVIAYYYPQPWTFPSLIVAGGLITLVAMWKQDVKIGEVVGAEGVERLGFNKIGGGLLILLWVTVLITTVVIAGRTDYYSNEELHWFAAFYRTGSVIFGGGQVVLPMLYNVVVGANCQDQSQRCCLASNLATSDTCSGSDAWQNELCVCSWISGGEFYAGLALAQAMPGPLFNFAAYLGAVIALNAGVFAIAGIALCWIGLFAPGILLIFAILPFWGAFRKWQVYKKALPGLNAAAIGLIVAAVFQLTLSAYSTSPFQHASICIGIIAFAATEVLTVPAPFVVIGGGVLGIIAWAAHMD